MKKNKTVIKEIIKALMKAKRVLIIGHANPDGDSLGSQLGVAELLDTKHIEYEIVNEGVIPGKYAFLPGIDRIRNIDNYQAKGSSFDTAVFIECSNLERIGNVQTLVNNGCKIINIDHHQDNSNFGDINFLDFEAAAAGEMVYELILDGGFEISKNMATNLYTAILTDTGRFHYKSTTPKSMRVAADLLDKGASSSRITDEIYYKQSINSLALTGAVLQGLEYFLDNRVCFMSIDNALLEKTKTTKADTDGLVNYALRAEGVLVGVLFSDKGPGVTKASFRSQNHISIVDVAGKHGGGGHKNACGCTLNMPVDEAQEIIVKEIEELLDGAS
ncbi:MAG: bifunctional oligoribonuclease/PAP phosphatase NrnA [candidate division Zixibacteria bacterium]|nr:bifunctional oligoribonuclease/PAP phosphatase NrnA [candidate division Zixibacteria bacterium]